MVACSVPRDQVVAMISAGADACTTCGRGPEGHRTEQILESASFAGADTKVPEDVLERLEREGA